MTGQALAELYGKLRAWRFALAEDLRPEDVVAFLEPAPVGCSAELRILSEGTLWWTLGAPRCSARTLHLSGPPDGETLAMMLDESAA
jgi:hypothetical protein